LTATTIPNCRAYDPCYGYELAVIIQDGLRRMSQEQEDVFYYITIYNENYDMPARPSDPDVNEGILRGLYRFRSAPQPATHRAQLLGSGPMVNEALRAQEILAERYDVAADVWSATSYTKLRREALECERHNREHPDRPARTPLVTQILEGAPGPIVASSDWMKAIPDQIARWVRQPFHTLGTDGFGQSDTRTSTRRFFRVDAENMVVATLSQLAATGKLPVSDVLKAQKDLGLVQGAAEPEASNISDG